jgi:hypothetical protein
MKGPAPSPPIMSRCAGENKFCQTRALTSLPTRSLRRGSRAIRLEDPADVEKGIADAFAHHGPVLVDAVVARSDVLYRRP